MPNTPIDVEESVVAWLNTILPAGFEASGEKPDELPEAFVLVDRTGGPRVAMVMDTASILIEVYHKTSQKAAKDVGLMICDRIRELEAVSDNLAHASINSFVHLDDTLAQFKRYQVYCDINGRR